jgi:hypothetical protein
MRQIHALAGAFTEERLDLITTGGERWGELFRWMLDRGAARVAEARLVAQLVSAGTALPWDGLPPSPAI